MRRKSANRWNINSSSSVIIFVSPSYILCLGRPNIIEGDVVRYPRVLSALDNHVLGKGPIQSDTYMPCKIGTVLLVVFVAETIGAMAASVPWLAGHNSMAVLEFHLREIQYRGVLSPLRLH